MVLNERVLLLDLHGILRVSVIQDELPVTDPADTPRLEFLRRHLDPGTREWSILMQTSRACSETTELTIFDFNSFILTNTMCA